MPLFAFLYFLVCFSKIIDKSHAIYSIPVCGENGCICQDKVFYIVDGGDDSVCNKYRICKLLFCFGDMFFSWFINGANRIFECLKEEEDTREIRKDEEEKFPQQTIISNEQSSSEPDENTSTDLNNNKKKSRIRFRRPCTQNRRRHQIFNQADQSFLQKGLNYWVQLNNLQEATSERAEKSIRKLNEFSQKPQTFINKILARTANLKIYYHTLLVAHWTSICMVTYKFLRSFYRWKPLHIHSGILRKLSFQFSDDGNTKAINVDLDNDESLESRTSLNSSSGESSSTIFNIYNQFTPSSSRTSSVENDGYKKWKKRRWRRRKGRW